MADHDATRKDADGPEGGASDATGTDVTGVPEIGIDEARPKLGDLIDDARFRGARRILTKFGRQGAAIVSIEDLKRLLALDATTTKDTEQGTERTGAAA